VTEEKKSGKKYTDADVILFFIRLSFLLLLLLLVFAYMNLIEQQQKYFINRKCGSLSDSLKASSATQFPDLFFSLGYLIIRQRI
jgi:hypothetical protein